MINALLRSCTQLPQPWVRWIASVVQGWGAGGTIPRHHSCWCYPGAQSSLYSPLTLSIPDMIMWDIRHKRYCIWCLIPSNSIGLFRINELSSWNSWCLWWLQYCPGKRLWDKDLRRDFTGKCSQKHPQGVSKKPDWTQGEVKLRCCCNRCLHQSHGDKLELILPFRII